MIHVAILKPGYIHAILDGRKAIESRLTKTMQPPHGKVKPGERLFLKASGGPFMATAIAGDVYQYLDMQPGDVQKLRKQFGKQIGGDAAYWDMKRDSKFATLVQLEEVEPISVGPAYKIAYMKAWYVLDEVLSPVRDWVITQGALRNRYACLPSVDTRSTPPGTPVTLTLPNREVVHTEIASGRRLRWRGWGPVYDALHASDGDTLRFVAMSKRHYTVRFRRR